MDLDALSFTLVGWSDVVLAFIALSFAARWPERRRDRVAFVLLVAAFAFQTTVRMVLRAPELMGTDLADPEMTVSLVALADITRLCVLAATGLLMLLRWSGSSPPARHLLGPVLLAGAASALVPLYAPTHSPARAGGAGARTVAVPTLWLTNAVRIVVPVAMLGGILRQRGSRAAVADAMATVGHVPTSVELQTALASALGDPSLRVLSWTGRRAHISTATASRRCCRSTRSGRWRPWSRVPMARWQPSSTIGPRPKSGAGRGRGGDDASRGRAPAAEPAAVVSSTRYGLHRSASWMPGTRSAVASSTTSTTACSSACSRWPSRCGVRRPRRPPLGGSGHPRLGCRRGAGRRR